MNHASVDSTAEVLCHREMALQGSNSRSGADAGVPAAQRCQHPARTVPSHSCSGERKQSLHTPSSPPPAHSPSGHPPPPHSARPLRRRSQPGPWRGSRRGGGRVLRSPRPGLPPPPPLPTAGTARPARPARFVQLPARRARCPPGSRSAPPGPARLSTPGAAGSAGPSLAPPGSALRCPAPARRAQVGAAGAAPLVGRGPSCGGRGALLPSRTPGSVVPSGRGPVGARGSAPRLEAARIPGLAAAMATPGTMVFLIPPLPGYQPPVLGRCSGGSPVPAGDHRGATWARPARCAPCSRRGKGRRLLLAKYLAVFRLMLLNILVTPRQYVNSGVLYILGRRTRGKEERVAGCVISASRRNRYQSPCGGTRILQEYFRGRESDRWFVWM